MTDTPYRIDRGRTPTKTTVQKRLPDLPVLGRCQGMTAKGERCPEKAKYRYRGTILCGRHYLPRRKWEEQNELDNTAYRDHHVQHYQSTEMMKRSEPELRAILDRYAQGTIPPDATVMERLRLEARKMAAEKELSRREEIAR